MTFVTSKTISFTNSSARRLDRSALLFACNTPYCTVSLYIAMLMHYSGVEHTLILPGVHINGLP